MTDAAGHSIAVDGQKFSASIHGSLQCSNCHADIKGYPHPDKVAPVDCKSCHADQAAQLKGSVHADGKEHPCTSCHGDAHAIFPKDRRALGGLSAQCAQDLRQLPQQRRHGKEARAGQRLPELHGFDSRLRAEQGRAAGGGQLPKLPRIAPHPEPQRIPQSPTYKTNIPKTCGSCHAKIDADYEKGVHGQGDCGRQYEGAGLHRLPHGARHSAAH